MENSILIKRNMENFAPITDDFLSSGFHQLYTELHDDELLLWDNDFLSNYNYNNNICGLKDTYTNSFLNNNNNNNHHNNINSYNNNNNNNISDKYLIENSSNNNNYDNNCDNSNEHNLLILESRPYSNPSDISSISKSSSSTSCSKYNDNDWELDLENLLLENTFDCVQYKTLPDKTFFCSDSCELFLKESSENLKLNTTEYPCKIINGSSPSQLIISQLDNDDKQFPCTYGICRKIYAKAAHLKAHMRRHLGDKPYVCTWPNCTWKFSRSDELARHRRSHSGIKPYQCCYCPKNFARSDHLSKHRKVHERKMAAAKIKELWTNTTITRPGRRPNTNKNYS